MRTGSFAGIFRLFMADLESSTALFTMERGRESRGGRGGPLVLSLPPPQVRGRRSVCDLARASVVFRTFPSHFRTDPRTGPALVYTKIPLVRMLQRPTAFEYRQQRINPLHETLVRTDFNSACISGRPQRRLAGLLIKHAQYTRTGTRELSLPVVPS